MLEKHEPFDIEEVATYNLTGTWHKQVVGDVENALQDGTMVQLYAFRRLQNNNSQLRFVLVNLDLN